MMDGSLRFIGYLWLSLCRNAPVTRGGNRGQRLAVLQLLHHFLDGAVQVGTGVDVDRRVAVDEQFDVVARRAGAAHHEHVRSSEPALGQCDDFLSIYHSLLLCFVRFRFFRRSPGPSVFQPPVHRPFGLAVLCSPCFSRPPWLPCSHPPPCLLRPCPLGPFLLCPCLRTPHRPLWRVALFRGESPDGVGYYYEIRGLLRPLTACIRHSTMQI